MTEFTYRAGQLCAEQTPLARIGADVGTPFYCYSSAAIEGQYQALAAALSGLPATICYAVKANSNLAVIRTLAALGAGADVVSEGELRRAMAAGIPANRIVFSGVGKTRRELELAVDLGLLEINVESEPELELLDEIGRSRGIRVPIALRVNPDVDAHTHAKITTGRAENKFGIEWTLAHGVLRRAAEMKGIEASGLAIHIGSQLLDLTPYRESFLRLRDLVLLLRAEGIGPRRLDLGGGLGVVYDNEVPPSPSAYVGVIKETLGDLGCSLMVEPGRFLVGNAGVLVSQVIAVKEGVSHRFLICDAGMNDLIRPALYEAYHRIIPVAEPAPGAERREFDVVGPVCETGDTFAKGRALPPIAAGEMIAFGTAGAYGAAMSSVYNSRPLVPEILVRGDTYSVVRARPSFEQMLALESLADWQQPKIL